MKKLIYTKHALERMEERGILIQEVALCFNNPQKTTEDYQNAIFYKIFGRKLLILICHKIPGGYKVITVIKTSKIYKYI